MEKAERVFFDGWLHLSLRCTKLPWLKWDGTLKQCRVVNTLRRNAGLIKQEHHKKTKLKVSDSLEQLKSSCPDATFKNIGELLKATITEICNTLDSRRWKKRTLNGKYTSPQALHSHISIITSSNDTATDRDTSPTLITTATTFHANHNTPLHPHKRHRSRRRNIRTTR